MKTSSIDTIIILIYINLSHASNPGQVKTIMDDVTYLTAFSHYGDAPSLPEPKAVSVSHPVSMIYVLAFAANWPIPFLDESAQATFT